MNIKNGILNVPKHGNKHDLIHFVTKFKTITETSPYSFGNFRKLSFHNCLMPI